MERSVASSAAARQPCRASLRMAAPRRTSPELAGAGARIAAHYSRGVGPAIAEPGPRRSEERLAIRPSRGRIRAESRRSRPASHPGGRMKIAGAVLVLLGFAGLVWGGVPYRQTRNVAQIGDLKMQVTEKKQLALPPLVSGFAI